MNPLINIAYLGTILYYILPRIYDYTKEPMLIKIQFVVIGLVSQIIFNLIVKLIKKEEIKIKKIYKELDTSLMKGLLILLGFMLYNDVKTSPNIMNTIPGLTQIINNRIINVIIMLIPLFVVITGKCLLKPI